MNKQTRTLKVLISLRVELSFYILNIKLKLFQTNVFIPIVIDKITIFGFPVRIRFSVSSLTLLSPWQNKFNNIIGCKAFCEILFLRFSQGSKKGSCLWWFECKNGDSITKKMTLNCYFQTSYCVKSIQIRSFFWSVFSRIQSEYGKIRTGKNSVFGHFPRSVKLSSLSCGYVLERNKQKKKEYFFILIVSCLNSGHQNTKKKPFSRTKYPKYCTETCPALFQHM